MAGATSSVNCTTIRMLDVRNMLSVYCLLLAIFQVYLEKIGLQLGLNFERNTVSREAQGFLQCLLLLQQVDGLWCHWNPVKRRLGFEKF